MSPFQIEKLLGESRNSLPNYPLIGEVQAYRLPPRCFFFRRFAMSNLLMGSMMSGLLSRVCR